MNVERNAVMSKAKPQSRPGKRHAAWLRRLLGVTGLAALLATAVGATDAVPVLARLTSVSATGGGGDVTVIIEASEPVPYVHAQPDPLTVVVDLRNATAGGVRNAIGSQVGPVAAVSVDDARGEDGVAIARVRLSLTKPATPTVRSRRNTILVEFGGASWSNGDTMVPTPVRAATAQAPPQPPAAARPARPAREPLTLKKVNITSTPSGTRIAVSGTGALPPTSAEATNDDPPRLVLDFRGVTAPAQTVNGPADGPVARVRVAQHSRRPLVARVVIDLRTRMPFRVEPAGGEVVVILEPAATPSTRPSDAVPETTPTPDVVPAPIVEPPPPPAAAVAAPPAAVAAPTPSAPPVAAADVAPPPAKLQAGADTLPGDRQNPSPTEQPTRQYTGNPVTFDFAQTDLRSVLRLFSEISGLNVVIDPAITGTVDVSLHEVPWDQALEIILRANKLGYIIENNVVRIASLSALADEEKDRRKLVDEQALSGTLRVMTRSLSYAKAADLGELLLKSALSPRGQVQVDPRTNTIIMTDLPASLASADALIAALDKSEPQVEIEARIVQTTRDSARALGVQWGMTGRMASELANTSPLKFPAQGSISGRAGGLQGNPIGPTRNDAPTGVNLKADGATSAVGISMGTLNGSLNLDVALSALERAGHGKVLSTPRVMMQNNFEAEMMQGIQIPIQTVSNNTVTVTFKDAALSLKVRPQISAANTVIMDIFLENATPDYSRVVNGIPPIDTQRARTQVLVNDNETTVIGGIVVQRETSANDKVPMLNRIPLLGWLFKRDTTSDENRELLIFITPRIRRQ